VPDLVQLADLKTFLSVTSSTDDALLTDLLEHLEALFEAETGRGGRPFQAAAADQAEVHDGTGSAQLFLNYPIADDTSVKLGYDSSDPVETLDPTDVDELVFAVGHRRLSRTDGGIFGRVGRPRYVHVVYDTSADVPQEAQLAIKRAVAQVYRQRGSEDSTYEAFGQGQYSRRLSAIVADDPLWARAVAANRRMIFA
jgi:hypothetical protein